MTIELWLAFVAASTIMLVIPGPTIITVIAYATSNGKKATLPLVAAVSLGDLTVISLSILGLGSLLAISATAFTVVKIMGGLYLLYLGFSMLRSARSAKGAKELASEVVNHKRNHMFFNTWLVTALNPKGILFFTAFLPQFIQTENPIAPQLITLTITFVFLAAINTLTYALIATRASRLLGSISAKQRFEFCGGVAISAAGLWTLTAEHTN